MDDLDYSGLQRAVDQSISYYERLPSTEKIQFGNSTYSPDEMKASLRLFMNIVEAYHGNERLKKLRDTFLFFESKNSDGRAFFTGYYEPLLDGSLEPTDEYDTPIYSPPSDLIEVDLDEFSDKFKGISLFGRLEGNRLVPYDTREEIVYYGSLKNRAEKIAYVNGIELFFLQIQGSGIIRFPDGKIQRVNYASQNGHPYRAIGRLLKSKIPEDEMSLQSIKSYLYAHRDEVRDILSFNQSYIFFRQVEEGPLGDIEVALTPYRSIAMDKRVVPRGGLAFIETELPVFHNGKISAWQPVKRFVLVQDTGGAIRDHGRVDIFFGHKDNAELLAGHLKRRGRVFLLVARKEFLR
jgi:membrane-bound lytic murein transglycosylase A